MSDTAHNTFVTVILILAIIIIAALFFRGFKGGTYSTYRYYQPASATIVDRVIPIYSQSVVSYSRPSTPVQTYKSSSSTYTSYDTTYDTTYTYSNPQPQVTYYGTGYTIPSYRY